MESMSSFVCLYELIKNNHFNNVKQIQRSTVFHAYTYVIGQVFSQQPAGVHNLYFSSLNLNLHLMPPHS